MEAFGEATLMGGKRRDTSASAWGWGRLFWCLRSHQSWVEGAASKLAWPRVVLGSPTLLDPEQLINLWAVEMEGRALPGNSATIIR